MQKFDSHSFFLRLIQFLGSKKNTFLFLLPVVIGALGGLGSFVFRKAVEFVHSVIFLGGSALLNIGDTVSTRMLLPILPIAGALVLLPVIYFFPDSSGYRLPFFLEKINLRGGNLKVRDIGSTILAAAITIGAGGSSGREGPVAKIGGIIGSVFANLFKLSVAQRKNLIACGVAAGIGAAFNAPIAGVFFAIEVVLLNTFDIGAFTPIVISSGAGTLVSRALTGNHSEFVGIPKYFVRSNSEYLLYALLGVLVGLVAVFFIRFFYKVIEYFESFKINPLIKPIIGMGLVGFIGIKFPQILSNGYESMELILNNQLIGPTLFFIVFLKILATSLTLGSGASGGVFAPSMFIGAALGGACGWTVNYFAPNMAAPAGLYALVGMAGFLAAVSHAPMTAIFLLFEITGEYSVIIPIMFTCVIGTALARWMEKETIDTYCLAKIGIDLHAGKEVNLLKSITVKESMTKRPETIPESMTLKELFKHFSKSRHISFPMVDADKLLTGILSIQDFREIAYEKDLEDLIIAKDIATLDVITVTIDDNLNTALLKIGDRNIEQVPVVSKDNPRKIVGILSRRDILSSYNRAIEKRLLEEQKKEMFVS